MLNVYYRRVHSTKDFEFVSLFNTTVPFTGLPKVIRRRLDVSDSSFRTSGEHVKDSIIICFNHGFKSKQIKE